MNHIPANFCSSKDIKKCDKCQYEMDNEHLVWCKYMNEESEFKYMNILNGDLEDKINTYKQI